MSGWKRLDRTGLPAFLAELAAQAEVLVPQEAAGRVRFGAWDPARPVQFPASLVEVSAKHLFFPRRRAVARLDGSGRLEAAAAPTQPRVVLGMHPCDVAAVTYADRVFISSGFRDALYSAERDRTTIIGMACSEMKPECHCTDRDLSPDDERGMDAVFLESGDGWLFRAITDKGVATLKSDLLKATADVPKKREWPKGRHPVNSKFLIPNTQLLQGDPFWDEVAGLCLTCGACTFACPTCTCFLVADEKHGETIERVTAWDSCQFSGYSRMSGGHNPRKSPAARVRNRMLDKLVYTQEKYGALSCVGCGRCAIICPVGRHFPREAAELSRKAEKA